MATSTTNSNGQATPNTTGGDQVEESVDKPTKRGNVLMRNLSPEMLASPYPLDFASGMLSSEFALEKCSRFIIEPLGFTSQQDWLNFAKVAWNWTEQAETRKKEALADELLARIEDDPTALEILKKKLAKRS